MKVVRGHCGCAFSSDSVSRDRSVSFYEWSFASFLRTPMRPVLVSNDDEYWGVGYAPVVPLGRVDSATEFLSPTVTVCTCGTAPSSCSFLAHLKTTSSSRSLPATKRKSGFSALLYLAKTCSAAVDLSKSMGSMMT